MSDHDLALHVYYCPDDDVGASLNVDDDDQFLEHLDVCRHAADDHNHCALIYDNRHYGATVDDARAAAYVRRHLVATCIEPPV